MSDVSSDPMYYDRSKHIARRDLFIRELVANNIIKPEFIRTEDNPADALTKPLPKVAFIKHRNKLLGIRQAALQYPQSTGGYRC